MRKALPTGEGWQRKSRDLTRDTVVRPNLGSDPSAGVHPNEVLSTVPLLPGLGPLMQKLALRDEIARSADCFCR